MHRGIIAKLYDISYKYDNIFVIMIALYVEILLLFSKGFSMMNYERRTNLEVSFHEDEVKLAKTMMDKLRTTVEFLYYLMDYRGKVSFTMITLSADNLKLATLLQKWKRQTDVLVEIDPLNNVYVIICQSTDREGGQKFAEILMSNISLHGGNTTFFVETELTSTKHNIQEVIFKMVEKYITIKQEKKSNKVYFTELNNETSSNNTEVNYHSDIST